MYAYDFRLSFDNFISNKIFASSIRVYDCLYVCYYCLYVCIYSLLLPLRMYIQFTIAFTYVYTIYYCLYVCNSNKIKKNVYTVYYCLYVCLHSNPRMHHILFTQQCLHSNPLYVYFFMFTQQPPHASNLAPGYGFLTSVFFGGGWAG